MSIGWGWLLKRSSLIVDVQELRECMRADVLANELVSQVAIAVLITPGNRHQQQLKLLPTCIFMLLLLAWAQPGKGS